MRIRLFGYVIQVRRKVERPDRHIYKCRCCGAVYPRLPTKKEYRRWCPNHNKPGYTERCYWMIFFDGSQTHDYPGE